MKKSMIIQIIQRQQKFEVTVSVIFIIMILELLVNLMAPQTVKDTHVSGRADMTDLFVASQ